MKEEKVKKLKEQFKKTYLDTVKHANDIEKWINSGKRKKGDIRRSIERLDSKYKSLLEIKTALMNQNSNDLILNKTSEMYKNKNLYIIEKELEFNKFENQLAQQLKIGMSMNQIKNKIEEFKTKINQPHQSKNRTENKANNSKISEKNEQQNEKPSRNYYSQVELVTDIPGNKEGLYYLEKRSKYRFPLKRKKHNKRSITDIKESILDKLYDIKISLSKRKKEKIKKHRKVGRISAFLMAGALALFGGTTAGESNSNTSSKDNTNNDKTFVDTNKDENNFKKSLYVQALEEITTKNNAEETTISSIVKATTAKTNIPEETWSTQPTVAQTNTKPTELREENSINKNQSIEKQEKTQNQKNDSITENKDTADDVYILKANTKYTENSLGEGATGYISSDTKVRIYNRAIIRTDEQGNKSILYVTNPGENWEDFAKKNGIDYKEFRAYIDNNRSIEEMVSLDAVNGYQLGWVSKDKLKGVEEIER